MQRQDVTRPVRKFLGLAHNSTMFSRQARKTQIETFKYLLLYATAAQEPETIHFGRGPFVNLVDQCFALAKRIINVGSLTAAEKMIDTKTA